MSEENVEVVREIFEAFNRRDWSAWESHHHPNVVWQDPPELPDSGTHVGVGEIRRFFEELLETGDDWHVEVETVESVGVNRVLMRGRSVTVGRVSRIPLDDPLFQLFELEDGRVRRVRTFRSTDEALEAAGLLE
jgi:ketosteroid isomerase-like protein